MIREVIVVEGKNDSLRLKEFFECETIETHGSGVSKDTIELIREINGKRGVILLLDPDGPGERIRNILNREIKGLRNAFLFKEDARTDRKVGVEHASKEALEEALGNLITYGERKEGLKMSDLYELGYIGNEDSAKKREDISRKYHLGKCNGKTLLKRLDLLGIRREDLE